MSDARVAADWRGWQIHTQGAGTHSVGLVEMKRSRKRGSDGPSLEPGTLGPGNGRSARRSCGTSYLREKQSFLPMEACHRLFPEGTGRGAPFLLPTTPPFEQGPQLKGRWHSEGGEARGSLLNKRDLNNLRFLEISQV